MPDKLPDLETRVLQLFDVAALMVGFTLTIEVSSLDFVTVHKDELFKIALALKWYNEMLLDEMGGAKPVPVEQDQPIVEAA